MKENLNSAWFFLIRKRPIAIILSIAIITLGLFSALTLPRELQPEIKIPFASIVTALPGASPLDIETLVTKVIEKEVSQITDIKQISSTSSFGVSAIFVEFETGTDMNEAILDLKDAVDISKNSLPEDALEPSVRKAEANEISIISFSLTGNRELFELTEIAEDLSDILKKIEGVSKVDIFGAESFSIFLTVDKEKAEKFGLDLQTISNTIKQSDLNFPIGEIQTENTNYSVRVNNEIKSIEEIEEIPLKKVNDTTIFIKDIAKIEKKIPEKNSISKFSNLGKSSKEAISIVVYKKTGGNIIKIAEESKNTLNTLKEEGKIPSDIEIAVSNDNSQFIKKDLGVLIENGLATALIITFILFLTLGFKEGLLAGLSIPLSFLITFSVMQYLGLSINSLSLFSLVIALGIMVDTAIVIMEGINKNIQEGHPTTLSCIKAVNTYKWALIAGTFTTIFAFFPMLLVSGIIGEFLKTLPIVISSALLSSLFVSLTLIPSISTKYLKKKTKQNFLEIKFEKFGNKISQLIGKIIESSKLRKLTVLTVIILFTLSMLIPISGMLKMELFPKTDIQYFYIDIEAPKGTNIEEMEQITNDIEKEILEVEEIENFLSIIGQLSASMNLGDTGPSQDSNLANITINLKDEEERTEKSFEIAERLRTKFKNFRKAKVTIQELSEGPPSEAAVTVKVSGENFDKLNEISLFIQNALSEIPGTENIKDDKEDGLNEFIFTFDKEKLNIHGISSFYAAQIIRNAVKGVESEEIKIEEDDLKTYIKYDFEKNEYGKTTLSISDLNNLSIQSPFGYEIQMSDIANFSIENSIASIIREDEKRIVKITSDIKKDANSVTITEELKEKLKDFKIPENYEISFGGDLEQINESFNQLYRSMIIGLLLIAFTLVLEFNSYKQAAIILLSLPLGVIGVFPGLFLINLNFSFPAFLGLVALSGVVVNNAIVLIDSINSNINDGQKLKEAIIETVKSRVRPIFLTTITTIVGILPLAISNPFWAGLGFTLSFGLAVSAITTLIVIPTIFYSLEKKKYE